MSDITFLMGYPGAGKTTTVRAAVSGYERIKTFYRNCSPTFKKLSDNAEVGSLWKSSNRSIFLAGCHNKLTTNYQGADVFHCGVPRGPALKFCAGRCADLVLWDDILVSPEMVEFALDHFSNVHVLWLHCRIELAMQRQDARKNPNHHLARPAVELRHMFEDTRWRFDAISSVWPERCHTIRNASGIKRFQ